MWFTVEVIWDLRLFSFPKRLCSYCTHDNQAFVSWISVLRCIVVVVGVNERHIEPRPPRHCGLASGSALCESLLKSSTVLGSPFVSPLFPRLFSTSLFALVQFPWRLSPGPPIRGLYRWQARGGGCVCWYWGRGGLSPHWHTLNKHICMNPHPRIHHHIHTHPQAINYQW